MKTIEIRTTQNVTIEYELASLRERMLAFFIDLVIVIALYIFLLFVLVNLLQDAILSSSMVNYVIYGLLPIVGIMFYQLFSEVFGNGQSWGKRSLGIKVVRIDGEEPGLSDYLLRAIFLLIDGLFSFGVVGSLLISSSLKNQRLGDMTANTTVIKVRYNGRFKLEDILSINTLDNYIPKYPQVKALSEEDMLLVKSTIGRYKRYRNQAHKEVVEQLVERIAERLQIEEIPKDRINFLQTLIRDYIVLTR